MDRCAASDDLHPGALPGGTGADVPAIRLLFVEPPSALIENRIDKSGKRPMFPHRKNNRLTTSVQ
ncbi:hypothetical protein CRP01_16805 [Flavilitoribacter nigricans DSM 23189 = NBRC 102662]|uniref:Uncharacterized protein n=1 Tax=Flavilitoribacter nigricans (strain ATCC 23147 / DSM 23189 / NBRC 102662 / NCIMB 1420 / SS-2) TaxID=1122177 RepID=A0A2D0NAI8_FLAN2|nr:hypothetical protein CRP01_16805 [Flavilitoribacter nigricans DSM 23189 = NBRC 102662]